MKYGNLTLGQIEAGINKVGGEAAFMRLLAGELVVTEKASSAAKESLLASLGAIDLPAIDQFIVEDAFTTKNTPGSVQLYYLGDNFKSNFLAKVEQNVAVQTLRSHRLTKASVDEPILGELGDKATTALAHLWELLKKQPKGEKGILLSNGYANIFYIEDMKGHLWAVFAYWYAGHGWSVDAYSVSGPGRWSAGYRVFSR